MTREKKTPSLARRIIGGIAAAILVLMLFAALGNSGSSSKTSSSTTSTQNNSSSLEANNSTDEQDQNSEISHELGINDILSTRELDFSINSIIETYQIINELGITYEPRSGNVLLLAMISATNTTEETTNVTNSTFNAYVDGDKITPTTASGTPVVGAIDGTMPLLGAISPGQTFAGYTVFEVPEGWDTFQFSYLDNWGDSEPYVIHASDIRG